MKIKRAKKFFLSEYFWPICANCDDECLRYIDIEWSLYVISYTVETQIIPPTQVLSGGAIAGIVVVVVLILLAIVIVTVVLITIRVRQSRNKIRAENKWVVCSKYYAFGVFHITLVFTYPYSEICLFRSPYSNLEQPSLLRCYMYLLLTPIPPGPIVVCIN